MVLKTLIVGPILSKFIRCATINSTNMLLFTSDIELDSTDDEFENMSQHCAVWWHVCRSLTNTFAVKVVKLSKSTDDLLMKHMLITRLSAIFNVNEITSNKLNEIKLLVLTIPLKQLSSEAFWLSILRPPVSIGSEKTVYFQVDLDFRSVFSWLSKDKVSTMEQIMSH